MSREVEITGIHPHPRSDWWTVCYRITTDTHITESELQVKAQDELSAVQGFMNTTIWKGP